MLFGKVLEETVSEVGGMVTSLRCVQLAKNTNDRLDKILAELDNKS